MIVSEMVSSPEHSPPLSHFLLSNHPWPLLVFSLAMIGFLLGVWLSPFRQAMVLGLTGAVLIVLTGYLAGIASLAPLLQIISRLNA